MSKVLETPKMQLHEREMLQSMIDGFCNKRYKKIQVFKCFDELVGFGLVQLSENTYFLFIQQTNMTFKIDENLNFSVQRDIKMPQNGTKKYVPNLAAFQGI